jgi:RimJ/RimL family protein N-acetyltransferase
MHEPPFETGRLILRSRGLEDLEACVAINSDPRVMTYLGTPWPPERQRIHLSGQMAKNWGPGLGYWSIFRRAAPDELLGWAGVVPVDDGPEVQVAYRLKPDAWGAGIATEAASRLLAHAFETLALPSVVALIHPDNRGSQNVIAKLGFTRDGDYGEPPQHLYRRLKGDTPPC